MSQSLRVGIFHPTLNGCGGAEWVALNMINGLKDEGHQTVVLTNKRIDNNKILTIFGEKARVDREIVFPLEPFPATDLHNVYTDAVRTLLLKYRCDVLIDTHSNAVLPGTDIVYIHFPLFGRLQGWHVDKYRMSYYVPYGLYERRAIESHRRLILANSQYTGDAITRIMGVRPEILYPPISEDFFRNQSVCRERENIVVSISRISSEKKLDLIPLIAKLTSERTRYLIMGLGQSSEELNRIQEQIRINKVTHRVQVAVNVPRQKILSILKRAKIFLHPAEGEHFGVSIVEAMASGCIPVVHNSGGPREFVPSYLRFNTIEEAAHKIETIISQWTPQQTFPLVRTARSFDRRSFLDAFLKMFKDYAQKHPRVKRR